MVAATPENRDVAARADDQHPPHEVTQDVSDEAAGDTAEAKSDTAQSAKKAAAPRKAAATKSSPAKPESK
jgi:hypothetical protein